MLGWKPGADGYITKPCQPGELKARLHTGHRILSLEDKLIEAREEMRYRATHDALTAIWNRASILSLMRSELERSGRKSTPTSILLCDVDHFKQVNDNHGHLIGDIVLQEVAKRITSAVRSYDAAGRYGGEEFLILLSNCDEFNLKARSEDIHAAVAKTSIVAGSEELPISVSVGAVTCQRWDPRLSIEHILARADAALYRAKADGRNRTVIADTLTPA